MREIKCLASSDTFFHSGPGLDLTGKGVNALLYTQKDFRVCAAWEGRRSRCLDVTEKDE